MLASCGGQLSVRARSAWPALEATPAIATSPGQAATLSVPYGLKLHGLWGPKGHPKTPAECSNLGTPEHAEAGYHQQQFAGSTAADCSWRLTCATTAACAMVAPSSSCPRTSWAAHSSSSNGSNTRTYSCSKDRPKRHLACHCTMVHNTWHPASHLGPLLNLEAPPSEAWASIPAQEQHK